MAIIIITKIKKIFSRFFINKKTFLVFLFFVFLGLFFPLKGAFAGWWADLIDKVASLPYMIINVIISVIGVIVIAISKLASLFLYGVTTQISNYSYTRHEVVKLGLEVTQGLANMFLIIILVFIALAIILRLKDYEAKKILPTFILVALLINFAPVLCGLVIDAANIVMNFFLKELTGFSQTINSFHGLWDTFKQGFKVSAKAQQELLAKLVVLIAFNVVLTFFLLLFAVILIARLIALWILVILSPLAFACYIMPATRKWAMKWWDQLIQWSFIGVTLAFFLYLAEHAGNLRIGSGVLAQLTPLVFIVLAAVYGFSTAAIGSSLIIERGNKAGKWIGRQGKQIGRQAGKKILGSRIGQATARQIGDLSNTPSLKQAWTKQRTGPKPWQWTKRIVATLGSAASSPARLSSRIPTVKQAWTKQRTGPKPWQRTKKGGVTLGAAAFAPIRRTGKAVGGMIEAAATRYGLEAQRKDIKEGQEKLKGTTKETKIAELKKSLTAAQKIATLNAAIEDGQFDDVKNGANISDEEIRKLIKKGKTWDVHKTIERANPHLADDPNLITTSTPGTVSGGRRITGGNTNIENAVASMSPKDYGNLSKSAIDITTKQGMAAMDAFIKNMNFESLKNAFARLGTDFTKAMEERLLTEAEHSNKLSATATQMGKSQTDPLVQRTAMLAQLTDWNPQLAKFVKSTAAKGMFKNL